MPVNEPFRVDWKYSGRPNLLWGSGAAPAERGIGYLASAIFPIGLYLMSWRSLDWTVLQYGIAMAIAVDVGGGVVANSLNSCKRFYHGAAPDGSTVARLAKRHWFFVAIHLQPFLVGLLFAKNLNWGLVFGAIWYGAIWIAYLILSRTPLYLKRPVAFFIVILGTIVSLYLVPSPPGFEWFAPLFLLKIAYGHLVPEEPYRPR